MTRQPACRIWALPVDALKRVASALPGVHDKLTFGLKKTVRSFRICFCYVSWDGFLNCCCAFRLLWSEQVVRRRCGTWNMACEQRKRGSWSWQHGAVLQRRQHVVAAIAGPGSCASKPGACLQVYYKLFSLSYARLALMRVFLIATADASRGHRSIADLERMLPGLSRSVDMGLVTILAWCVGHAASQHVLHDRWR